MDFVCIGGDRRQIEIARFLKAKGFRVSTLGLPAVSDIPSFKYVDDTVNNDISVILPVPLSRDNLTVCCIDGFEPIFIDDIIKRKPKIVFGGIIKQEIKEKLCDQSIKYYDYFISEPLTVKNAILTAEAAISIAIQSTKNSIFNSKSLVIGYGRIGRQLAKYLKVMGSHVTATSRDDGTRAIIDAEGFISLDTAQISNVCGDFDYIFNTVPFPVMDKEFFAKCKNTVFVEDLATNSGCDLNAALENGINASVYSGLPGKYSPCSAAEYIALEILRKFEFLKSEEKA